MNEKQMTAQEWLRMRARLAEVVRGGHPRMESATSVRLAEHLILAGVIDFSGLDESEATDEVND